MRRITLTTLKQTATLSDTGYDVSLKWLACMNEDAILRLESSIGLSCTLHINKALIGSIFEFEHKKRHLGLSIEQVTMRDSEITQIVLLVD